MTSKTASLVIMGITSLISSRTMFAFINDPEGPNLLIVVGLAVIVFAISLLAYLPYSAAANTKKLLLAILLQVVATACLYFILR